jgi:hypothetical protein
MRRKLCKQVESIGTSVEDKAKYIYMANQRFTYSKSIRPILYTLEDLEKELDRYELITSRLLDEKNAQRLNEANKEYSLQFIPRLIDIWIDMALPKRIRGRAEEIKEAIFRDCLPEE